jgi:hypothetical protein
MKACRGSSGVVSIMLWPFCPLEITPVYIACRLGGSQSSSGSFGEEKKFLGQFPNSKLKKTKSGLVCF